MLAGPRLMLRPLTARDAERSLSGSGLGELTFVDDYPSTFATEVLRLVACYAEVGSGSPRDGGGGSAGGSELGPWLIVRQSDRTVVGTLSCARQADGSAVTVGYDVADSCRGRGYATEALRVVVDHLLGMPEVWRVCAEAAAGHVASRRVMEKAGLSWLRDEVDVIDGREVKLAHYAIERPDAV